MNSSSIGSSGPAPSATKTEWAQDVTRQAAPTPVGPEESFGAQLNRMAGVVDTGKVKYGAKEDALNKDAFLKMTMEQIKFQDPLNPVQNEQFTQQMAMLSQLEQQVNMNSTLKSILDNSRNMQIAALQLVGKDVSADTAMLYHEANKATSMSFKIPTNTSDLKVEVLSEAGEVMRNLDVGPRSAGTVNTKWDGMLNNGVPAPGGKYSFRVVAKGADGKSVDIPSKIDGRVTGVTTQKGQTFLLVGDQKVALNDVQSIHEPKNQDLASGNDENHAGIKNVSNQLGGEMMSQKSSSEDSAPGNRNPVVANARPQIAVSDEAKDALQDGAELGSLFPLLYR